MTPKEKANELVRDFREILDNDFPRKKEDAQYNFLAQCNAIKSVEHIMYFMDKFDLDLEMKHQYEWWHKVRIEIASI